MPDVDKIIAFENGELDHDGVLELFADLVRTGQAWQLQGSYGRTANALIDGGFLSLQGEVLADVASTSAEEEEEE